MDNYSGVAMQGGLILLTFLKICNMKRLFLLFPVFLVLFFACRYIGYKKITGNGTISTQERSMSKAGKIKLEGSFDVEIAKGASPALRIEADENLIPYIITEQEDGMLVLKTKNRVNLVSKNNLKIYITTPELAQVTIAGSGNIKGMNKFTGENQLVLKIAGTGDIHLDINTPEVKAEIAGSGSIDLKGETRNETIQISGIGNFHAEELKAENAKIKIAGSGDVKVYAENTLDISIAGMGSVYYKGNATVTQKIAGSGEVKKIQ